MKNQSLTTPVKTGKVINILIVDDRPENLLTLESILERDGRNIIKANGGNEALRISIREEIGLIMLDIHMPDIDGYEVANLLRSNTRTSHIPIIFVTAVNNNDKPSLTQYEEGTVDFLSKPLDLEDTLSKVAVYEKLYHMRCERNTMQLQTEQLKKSMEQFIYIVSHDLKAPLRAIENLSSWVAEDLGPNANENTSENLSLLQSRVNRMSALIDGILEYSRSGRIDEPCEKINLNGLAHAIFESLAPPAGCIIEASELPEVIIEKTRIYKIFYHLLKNAIDHHHDVAKGKITFKCSSDCKVFTISVIDNGPGIKIQYAEKIFEMFSTLSARDDKDTVGAGLAIVRNLLHGIDQKIWLDTSNEKGSVFKFTLPV